MSDYTVTAPLVVIPNIDGTTGDGYFYEDAVVPSGWNDERCKVLAGEGMLKKVSASKASAESGQSDKVDDIVAEVGDDKAKAAAALESEKSGKNRKTLVDKLESIVGA